MFLHKVYLLASSRLPETGTQWRPAVLSTASYRMLLPHPETPTLLALNSTTSSFSFGHPMSKDAALIPSEYEAPPMGLAPSINFARIGFPQPHASAINTNAIKLLFIIVSTFHAPSANRSERASVSKRRGGGKLGLRFRAAGDSLGRCFAPLSMTYLEPPHDSGGVAGDSLGRCFAPLSMTCLGTPHDSGERSV